MSEDQIAILHYLVRYGATMCPPAGHPGVRRLNDVRNELKRDGRRMKNEGRWGAVSGYGK